MLDLAQQLKQSLPMELYGVGEALPLEALLEEVASQDASIEFEDGVPIRKISAVLIQVLDPSDRTLVEAGQLFRDGRFKDRGRKGVTEKIKIGESLEAAVVRALKEELGLEQGSYTVEAIDHKPVEVEGLSQKYPGLTTRHRWFDAKVRLAAAAVQEQYIEEQPEKQTFFRWQSAEG